MSERVDCLHYITCLVILAVCSRVDTARNRSADQTLHRSNVASRLMLRRKRIKPGPVILNHFHIGNYRLVIAVQTVIDVVVVLEF